MNEQTLSMNEQTLKVGDEIIYRTVWGTAPPVKVTVEQMGVTEGEGEKYAPKSMNDVPEVAWDLVRANRVIFDLSNGKWAYSEAVDVEASLKLKGSSND